jgi:hypothetical protein
MPGPTRRQAQQPQQHLHHLPLPPPQTLNRIMAFSQNSAQAGVREPRQDTLLGPDWRGGRWPKQGSEAHCTMTYIRTCTVQPSGQASISKASTISSTTARSSYWCGRSRGSSIHPIPRPGPPSRPSRNTPEPAPPRGDRIATPQERTAPPPVAVLPPFSTEGDRARRPRVCPTVLRCAAHIRGGPGSGSALRRTACHQRRLLPSCAKGAVRSYGGFLPSVFVPSPAHIDSLCLS